MVTEGCRWTIDRARNFEGPIDVSISVLGGYSALECPKAQNATLAGTSGATDAALARSFSQNVVFL